MTDIDEFAKVLTSWKDQDKRKIFDVLKRVDTLTFDKWEPFDTINKAVQSFHKQIQHAQKQLIDNQWFAHLLKIKKKLKRFSESNKGKDNKKPQLTKKQSNVIQYPEALFEGVRTSETQGIKILYKNFIKDLADNDVSNTSTVEFIKKVNLELRILFKDEIESLRNKRIDSICMHLSKQGCVKAKIQMINGIKQPLQVANDSQKAYKDQQTSKRIQQALQQQFKMSELGYYDNMKKNIFKDAAQQCRFCKKPHAYCDDMKQIRAADEPMTRFMKCNNCNKNWRD